MPDQFTSDTGNEKLYRARIEPSGEVYFITAPHATAAAMKVAGLVEMTDPKPAFNGSFDVEPATEAEARSFYGTDDIDIPDWVGQGWPD